MSVLIVGVVFLIAGCGCVAPDPLADVGHGEAVAEGRDLYMAHGCAACHGLEGSGDGPSARSLPVPPRDYRDRRAYKRGSSVQAVAGTIATGLGAPGAAMPSFAHLAERDRFLIASFVVAQQREPGDLASESRQPRTGEPPGGVDPPADHIRVEDPWVRPMPIAGRNTGAYVKLSNSGVGDDALVAVETDAAEVGELHEMKIVDEMMRMARIERIALPVAETVALQPGGLHLMLIGLKEPLEDGDHIEVTLRFASGTEKRISMAVRAPEGSGGEDHVSTN